MLTKKPIDWNEKERRAREMSDEALLYSIRDCLKASEASKGWNPINEGYYADEAFVYIDELKRRQQAKKD